MKDKGRVALARIVLTNRKHVTAIELFGNRRRNGGRPN
jgi:non-homologous end joining protein Ku